MEQIVKWILIFLGIIILATFIVLNMDPVEYISEASSKMRAMLK